MIPQMPQQGPSQGGQPTPPNMGPFMQAAQGGQPQIPPGMQPQRPPMGQPPQQGGQPQITPQMIQQLIQLLASQGRNGDTQMAHMTPGEIAVPPQVQSPKVLATLNKAFHDKHVQPQQFQVGNPASSVNPKTGAPEYNFMSAFLPTALGLAGAFIAPELLPEMAASGSFLPGALGSGAGNALGGLLSGEKPMQAILGGAGAGAGSYFGGNLAGGKSLMGADQAAGSAYSAGSNFSPSDIQKISSQMEMPPTPPSASSSSGGGMFSHMMPPNSNIGSTLGGMAGGYIGSALGAPYPGNKPNYPPGFMNPMTPVNQLPSWQTQLGQNTYNGPKPNFNGYNPLNTSPANWNFYPPQG